MLLEATLVFHANIEQRMFRESLRSICDADKRFIEAELKEDRYTRELFEKLLETIERDSIKRWEFR